MCAHSHCVIRISVFQRKIRGHGFCSARGIKPVEHPVSALHLFVTKVKQPCRMQRAVRLESFQRDFFRCDAQILRGKPALVKRFIVGSLFILTDIIPGLVPEIVSSRRPGGCQQDNYSQHCGCRCLAASSAPSFFICHPFIICTFHASPDLLCPVPV